MSYEYYDYSLEDCAGLSHLLVGKIVLDELYGKKNLPNTPTPADKLAKNTH